MDLMMNEFTQHIPAWVVQMEDRAASHTFATTFELLELDVVQSYSNEKDFSHFALSRNCLMAIYDDGFRHWVAGYIKYPNKVNLPKWDGWKFRALLPNGKQAVLSSEVVSSCGNILTLRDGTTAIDLGK